jgi:hypothetical protein
MKTGAKRDNARYTIKTRGEKQAELGSDQLLDAAPAPIPHYPQSRLGSIVIRFIAVSTC